MLKTVIAMEQDGFNVRVLTFNFDIPNKEFDLIAAVRAACVEFCQSEDGRRVFEGNCDSFNWGDFDIYVSDEICQKHGFRKVNAEIADETVNFDEQLVDESDVYLEDEEELTIDDRIAGAVERSADDGGDKQSRGLEDLAH